MEKILTIDPVVIHTIILGPVVINGRVKILLANGEVVRKNRCFICRCGRTTKEPFCDGSHSK